jgi:F0F1-type ATP synthase alpha subunit
VVIYCYSRWARHIGEEYPCDVLNLERDSVWSCNFSDDKHSFCRRSLFIVLEVFYNVVLIFFVRTCYLMHCGIPVDGAGKNWKCYTCFSLNSKHQALFTRQSVREPSSLLVLKLLICYLPIGRGQRELINRWSSNCKTAIGIDCNYTTSKRSCIMVSLLYLCAIGQRQSLVLNSSNKLKSTKALANTIIVSAYRICMFLLYNI